MRDIPFNVSGISEVFAEGKNLGECKRARYTMLYAPRRGRSDRGERRVMEEEKFLKSVVWWIILSFNISISHSMTPFYI